LSTEERARRAHPAILDDDGDVGGGDDDDRRWPSLVAAV